MGLVKAVPIFDSWVKALALAYSEYALAKKDREFSQAMITLVTKHDQRELEEAIGSPNAGKPTTNPDGVESRPRTTLLVALIASSVALSSCVTRSEIMIDIWQHDRLSEKVCNDNPELKQKGIFRVITCKANPQSINCQHGEESYEEFLSYCKPQISNYLGMHKNDVDKWLRKAGVKE
jgi:hypothetical protein